MPVKAGSTFFIKGTGGHANPSGWHLSVCLTKPCSKGNVLVVTIVTYRPGFDTSCMIAVGDHIFIKHQSSAAFARAAKVYAAAVDKDIDGDVYVASDDVSPEILKRLRDGLFKSGDTPPFALEYAVAEGLRAPPKDHSVKGL